MNEKDIIREGVQYSMLYSNTRFDGVASEREIREFYRNRAFEQGAKWMQEAIISEAIQWLFKNVYDYLNPEDQERVESFRIAMKQ